MAVWSNRFEGEENEALNRFNASILFDQKLAMEDIEGSLAHVTMLESVGIVSPEDARAIRQGLREIRNEIAAGTIELDLRYEDIHMAIEELLTERIGQAGKRLHTARSRNDQVALDVRLYCRSQLIRTRDLLKSLISVLLEQARGSLEMIMPGYTHLQRAQPITLAHWLCAYASMFSRDIQRLEANLSIMDESPLGAGALAASGYPIDRAMTAELLDFSRPMINSLDAVSDRDYCIQSMSDLSLVMMHLSRLCEELISFSSSEFGFIRLDDALSTGSSIMPQKKNPDLLELIRGKSARVYGHLFGLLTLLKGLPLAYNKDLQEDKEALFDGFETVQDCLEMMILFMQNLHPNPERMLEACRKGYLNATDLADYLCARGLPFREAYQIVGQIVRQAAASDRALEEISLEEYQNFHPLFDSDLYDAIDLIQCVYKRNVAGGPAPRAVLEQIRHLEETLA